MAVQKLIMPYSDDLLLSLKSTPERFEAEARLLLATKLYELGRVTTSVSAQLAGMDRVSFMFDLHALACLPLGTSRTSWRRVLPVPDRIVIGNTTPIFALAPVQRVLGLAGEAE